MDEKEKERQQLLLEQLPNVSSQLSGALSNIGIAVSRLAPPEARDQDPQLDKNAAILYQSYYRILRTVNNLTDAASLLDESLLPVENGDIVAFCREICQRAESPARLCRLQP